MAWQRAMRCAGVLHRKRCAALGATPNVSAHTSFPVARHRTSAARAISGGTQWSRPMPFTKVRADSATPAAPPWRQQALATAGTDAHVVFPGTEMYGNDDGTIPATFQLINIVGWKPDPSQVRKKGNKPEWGERGQAAARGVEQDCPRRAPLASTLTLQRPPSSPRQPRVARPPRPSKTYRKSSTPNCKAAATTTLTRRRRARDTHVPSPKHTPFRLS